VRVFRGSGRGRGRNGAGGEEPTGAKVLPKGQRFQLFLERLRGQAPAANGQEALQQVRDAMNQVEDAHSGAPNNPENFKTDGRMYPPQDDAARAVSDHPGVTRYRSKAHNTFIRDNGAIEIRPADSGTGPAGSDQAIYRKPGADGRNVWDN